MKMTRTVLSVCVLAVLGSIGRAFQGPSVSGVPADLYDRDSSGVIRHGFQLGLLSYGTAGKTVTFSWEAGAEVHLQPTGLKDPAYEMQYLDRASRILGTRYYPSAMTVAGHETVLVAGVKDNGKTVIEKWTLTWPTAMPYPDSLAGGGGPLGTVPVVIPNRTGVAVLFNEDTVGKRVVRNMTPLRKNTGDPDTVLVQFSDSFDVYQMDVGTGALSLIASPVTVGGVGPIPTLGLHYYNYLGGAERFGYGFVYIFTYLGVADSPNWPEVVVLQDLDMDGVLDAHMVVPATDYWGVGKWGDENEYFEPWK